MSASAWSAPAGRSATRRPGRRSSGRADPEEPSLAGRDRLQRPPWIGEGGTDALQDLRRLGRSVGQQQGEVLGEDLVGMDDVVGVASDLLIKPGQLLWLNEREIRWHSATGGNLTRHSELKFAVFEKEPATLDVVAIDREEKKWNGAEALSPLLNSDEMA